MDCLALRGGRDLSRARACLRNGQSITPAQNSAHQAITGCAAMRGP